MAWSFERPCVVSGRGLTPEILQVIGEVTNGRKLARSAIEEVSAASAAIPERRSSRRVGVDVAVIDTNPTACHH
jgi:hypothetical protein